MTKFDSVILFDVFMPNGEPAGMIVKLEGDAADASIENLMDVISRTAGNLMHGVTFDKATVVDLHDEIISDAFVPENTLAEHMGPDKSMPHPMDSSKKCWMRHVLTVGASEEEE